MPPAPSLSTMLPLSSLLQVTVGSGYPLGMEELRKKRDGNVKKKRERETKDRKREKEGYTEAERVNKKEGATRASDREI